MADAATICHSAKQALNQRQYEQARELFLQALDQNPDHPDGHYGLATACFLQGDLLGAAHHFREVTRLDPLRAGAFVNLGAIYNRLGRYEDAITALRRGIQLDPRRAEGFYNLGLVYRQQGQSDRAVDAYREAVRVNPKMTEAHFNLANLLLELEKFSAAIVHYRQALKLRSDWPEARQGLQMAEEAVAEKQAAAQAAVLATLSTVKAPHVSSTAAEQDLPRIDPRVHGNHLGELHQLTKAAEQLSHQIGDNVAKELDNVLKVISAVLIKTDRSPLELAQTLEAFTKMIERFQQAQKKLREARNRFQATHNALKQA